ncbi:hypothetical protein WMY93_006923 [Mugilogobius chulae]|uniref:Uncharacterized protein n=1 Tax=Mugilogobius chulae TaxID=88201 RepID=A0AAW0Q0X2_9GOBI
MTLLTSDSDAALGQMKQIGQVVREDHKNLVSNYAQMKSLLEKSRESQVRMIQKVKDALQQKEDMHTQMEQAISARDAAYSVMDQLRKHYSMEISELEKCVGSQEELLSALRKAHPEQVALNKAYSETLNSASALLSKTTGEQSSLAKEFEASCRVYSHTLRLNETAEVALRERDEHIAERDQVCKTKSRDGSAAPKASESDEDRAQLDRKATELSATVSSTLASYAFLEQALASETTKLQQSWADIKQAKERSSLVQSSQRVSELSEALGHREEQVSQLQSLSEDQALQLQQLQELCTQLSGVRDENETCKQESARRAGMCPNQTPTCQTEHKEKLEQIVTEIAILHHTVRSLTNELQASVKEENHNKPPPQNISNSFVDSVIVALTTENDECPRPDAAEAQSDLVFSESSAFTRITAVTPKRCSPERDAKEQRSSVSELLVGLDTTVTELRNTLTSVQQRKDTRLKEQQDAIFRLQRELEDANSTRQTEVWELQYELNRLKTRMEKANESLQQKAQVDKTVSKLVSEISEIQEMLNKHKADNNELRKEVSELRRSLQQSSPKLTFCGTS